MLAAGKQRAKREKERAIFGLENGFCYEYIGSLGFCTGIWRVEGGMYNKLMIQYVFDTLKFEAKFR